MIKGARIVMGSILVLVITIITILLLSIRLVRKSLPQTNGTIKLHNLRSTVKIYRDDYGVPHILANNEEDLFFTMGFVTAQDRLWQMDISRRIATGKLSEIYGEKTLETDKLFRTIGLYRTAEKISKRLSPESYDVLRKYASGVNAFIIANKDNLPLEFTILNYKPQLWKIEDSIACQRLLAWGLALGRHYDLIFGSLIEKLGLKKVSEIFPEYSASDPQIILTAGTQFSKLHDRLFNLPHIIKNWIPEYPASNCWVISGEKSNTGKPLLANDPHLKLTLPSMLYEAHLVAPFINVYGVLIPGMVGVISGHNTTIAWGSTNMMVDDMDFFVEQVDSNLYSFKYKWFKMDTSIEIIHLKEQPPETLIVRSTKNGPIISDALPVLKNSNQAVSMKWTGHEPSDETLTYYRIMKAGNWGQFKAGIKHYKVPGQNFVYADTLGNIGYWGSAAIPIRKRGTGEIPQPGWNDRYQWIEYVPFEELPHVFNPPQQYIVTANNKIDESCPHFISNYWEPPYRASRIIELLSPKDKLGIKDFKKMQFDRYSKHAEFILPIVVQAMPDSLTNNNLLNYFYDSIRYWDFTLTPEKTEPAIFNQFFSFFIANIFKDEMGDTLYKQFIYLPALPIRATDRLLSINGSKWFDDVSTPQIEDKNSIILKSLDQTYNYLVQNRGKYVDEWRWGKLHQVSFEHQVGKQKPLNIIWGIGRFPIGGGNCTINLGEYLFTNPFTSIIGPATRRIADLADVNNSLSVITPGQSGQPLNKHYKDQVQLWIEGKYHSTTLSVEQIEKSNFDLLILKPK